MSVFGTRTDRARLRSADHGELIISRTRTVRFGPRSFRADGVRLHPRQMSSIFRRHLHSSPLGSSACPTTICWPWRTDHLTHTHCPFWTQKLPCFRPHSVEQSAWQSDERGHLTGTVQAIVENCLVWARILVGGACEKSDFNRRRVNVQFDWFDWIHARRRLHHHLLRHWQCFAPSQTPDIHVDIPAAGVV